MKRKTILSALFSAFVACSFVACSNDSDALDINVGTRSVGLSSYMTRLEIQERLDEIGEKYGKTIILVDDADTTKVTEEFFIWVESSYKNDNGGKITEFAASIIDDEQIDEIAIPEIGTYAAPGEVNSHTGTILNNHTFRFTDGGSEFVDWVQVIITWYANTGGGMNKATAELVEVVVSGKYNLIGFSHSPIIGDVSNPCFSYSYTILHPNNDISVHTGLK